MKKVISFLFCLSFASHAVENPLVDVYETELINQPTGYYRINDQLFFVVKQPCLSKKKYAGTKEAKQAERAFFQLIVDYGNEQGVKIDPSSLPFKGKLQQAIKQNLMNNIDFSGLFTSQLLLDRSADGCIREYVKAVTWSEKPFITPTLAQIKQAIGRSLMATNNKPEQLAQYMQEVGLEPLANVIEQSKQSLGYPVVLTLKEAFTEYKDYCQDTDRCHHQRTGLNQYDFNRVLATAMAKGETQKIFHATANEQLGQAFYDKANVDFDNGVNSDEITKNLTLSVNFDPSNKESWMLLSSMYISFGQFDYAEQAAYQIIMQEPTDFEAWVYLFNAYKAQNKPQANALHTLLNALLDSYSFTDWARNKIISSK